MGANAALGGGRMWDLKLGQEPSRRVAPGPAQIGEVHSSHNSKGALRFLPVFLIRRTLKDLLIFSPEGGDIRIHLQALP